MLGEDDLHRYDPAAVGYRYFLIETPPGQATAVQQVLQQKLGDYGFAQRNDRRAAQRLGRRREHVSCHVPESRRAGALVGHYRAGRRAMAERLGAAGRVGPAPRRRFPRANAGHPRGDGERVALLLGLGVGLLAALVAVLPHLIGRGAAVPFGLLAAIFALVLVAGLAASLAAMRGVLRTPILPACARRGRRK